MVKQSVMVSFIERMVNIDDEQIEKEILSESFPFYPSYNEGETIFIKSTEKGVIDPLIPLTRYRIIEVHHSITLHKKRTGEFEETVGSTSLEIYLRKFY